jgi:hypothetical protein
MLFSSGRETTSFVLSAMRILLPMGLSPMESVVTCRRDGYEWTTMELAMVFLGQVREVAAEVVSAGVGRELWVLSSSLQQEEK